MKTELKPSEKLIFETKPHWITLLTPIVLTMIITIIVIIFCLKISLYFLFLPGIFVTFLIYKLLERNNNLWAVTNLRVIDERGVFSNFAKESPLDKINNISFYQSLWGKFFGYGNVEIQTAAGMGSTVYFTVTNPKKLKDIITQMKQEYNQFQISRQADGIAKAILSTHEEKKYNLSDELEKLFELKQKGALSEEEFIEVKKRMLKP